MDEDDTQVEGIAPVNQLLYDWFKHITSLTVLTIGGVMALSQQPDVKLPHSSLLVVLICLVGSGISAFSGSVQIVDAGLQSKPLAKSILWLKHSAIICLLIGIGSFTGMFLKAVSG